MIYIDDTDPEGTLEPSFKSRDVTIKRGVDAKELYELISEVGRGKFGTVYKCRERSTGLKLAAKFVPIPKREDRRNVEREVEIMNSLQHHLIIQLYAAYEYQKMMCVVLELVEGGELFDRVIDDDFVLTERVCTVFMRQVCEAMQFIHRNNILHLDMKPENILCLTKEGNRIKIIDFGLARKYDPDKKLQILFGTPEFVAPEVVNFDTISYGTDMWSVGVICYVLLSGLSPFMGETDIETMANVTVAKYDFDDEAFSNVSPEALEFISKLLLKDCSARMTASECLEHKWLQRKSRPPVAPKPVAPPPPKYVTTPPSPPRDIQELETTKDNLKTFIERWEEHPNSPYVFDTTANLISPLHDTKRDSLASSRVCTPSPCESICSVSGTLEDFNDVGDEDQKEQEQGEATSNPEEDKNLQDYLQSFDRRNSDTSYILGRRPSGERINLADEIRKLSDHLLMLAEINTRLGKENEETIEEEEECSSTSTTNVSQPNHNSSTKSQGIVDEISSESTVKMSNSSLKTNSTVEHTKSTRSVIKTKRETETHKEVSVTSSKSSSNVSSLTVRLQSLEDTPVLTNGNIEEKGKKLLNGFKQLPTVQEGVKYTDGSCGVPWTVTNKRTKFKINQLSRDVPVGSPDSHQPFNLEEAANNTKDCLLHLLEKYNQTKLRNGSGGRHQSISVDWNISENLEYRTMSSINAFFQRHSTSGSTIKQLRAQLEAKCKQ